MKKYNITSEVKNKFLNTFNSNNYPIIKIIDNDNFYDIVDESSKMRNTIRGQKIGELG